MLTSEAIANFGSIRALARALDISVQAIYAWGETVPALRGYQIRELLAQRETSVVDSQPKEAAA